MAEYIDLDTPLELYVDRGGFYSQKITTLRELLDTNKIPYTAADVLPVVRGRWIRHYEQADTGEDIIAYPCGWVCSECGRWESEDEPFCNCGAMMEES